MLKYIIIAAAIVLLILLICMGYVKAPPDVAFIMLLHPERKTNRWQKSQKSKEKMLTP